MCTKPKGHPHAELMAQYAEDAKETDTPWEGWEIRSINGIWVPCTCNPDWSLVFEYRRRPQVILINGIEVPAPVRRPLQEKQEYWYVDTASDLGAQKSYWRGSIGSSFDRYMIRRGLVHLSFQNAHMHYKALVSLSEQS